MPDKRKRKPVAIEDIEARILKEYRRLRRRTPGCHFEQRGSTSFAFMTLARRWKRPIVDIKRIVNYKGAANRPVVYQTAEEHRLTVAHRTAENIRRRMEWEEWRNRNDKS